MTLRFTVFCAVLGCSVGDFPSRRDAGAGVDAPADSAMDSPTDKLSPGDRMGSDAQDLGEGAPCSGGRALCAGACVQLMTDGAHCGRCGNNCSALPHVNGAVACVAGRCDLARACADGYAHCSARDDDGCEAEVNQTSRCGTCATSCIEPLPFCRPREPSSGTDGGTDGGATGGPGYVCRSGCDPMARCGGGCVDTRSSLVHCGACSNACPAPVNGTPTCTEGRCGYVCSPGFGDCDMASGNGCETDVRSSVSHCGRCANACPARASATATCGVGLCGVACNPGFGDCDRREDNGCEVDTRSSGAHCGMCGNVCPTGPNAVAVCRAGLCALTCATGFADCDLDPTNGCEVNTRTSVTSCGMCRRACPGGPNATAVCTSGECGIGCRAPFGNCDGFDGNGCETDLTTAATHCGLCGNACPNLPGSIPTCAMSTCGYACTPRFLDCDGQRTNGCESDSHAQGNCGCCGRSCGISCFMGACIPEGTCI